MDMIEDSLRKFQVPVCNNENLERLIQFCNQTSHEYRIYLNDRPPISRANLADMERDILRHMEVLQHHLNRYCAVKEAIMNHTSGVVPDNLLPFPE